VIVYMQCVQFTSELPLQERRCTYILSTHRIVEVDHQSDAFRKWHADRPRVRVY